MDVKKVRERYPTLCAVSDHPRLIEDLEKAATAAASTSDRKGLWDAYQSKQFAANDLTFWLAIHEFGEWADSTADEMESNLATVAAAAAGGLADARRAYRDKLLAKDHKQFTDVRYEIGAASGAATFFDQGTLQLEEGIGGAKKNSDIKGARGGKPVRMEVRVVHDEWPPGIDEGTEEIIRGADIPIGYSVLLAAPPDAAAAERAKGIIEALYKATNGGPGNADTSVVAGGVEFWFDPAEGSFAASGDDSMITSISFGGLDREDRYVSMPAFLRSTVDPQERDFFKNPKGVTVFSGEMAEMRTYKDQPLSTKIAQAVAGKARQCEENVVNVIALGTPSPMVDNDVIDALGGARAAAYVRNPDGSFHNAGYVVKPSGMFVPAGDSEDAANLVDPYRIISAVWHIRLGASNPQSRLILNPNAAVPLAEEDAVRLAKTLN